MRDKLLTWSPRERKVQGGLKRNPCGEALGDCRYGSWGKEGALGALGALGEAGALGALGEEGALGALGTLGDRRRWEERELWVKPQGLPWGRP